MKKGLLFFNSIHYDEALSLREAMKFLRIFLVILLFLTAGLLSIYYLSVGHVPLMKTVVTGNWISNILYGNDNAFVTNAEVRGNGELLGREGGNRSVDDKNGTDSSIKDVTGTYSPTREVTGDDSPAGDERLKQVPMTANSATGTVTNADGIDDRNARDDPIPHPEDVNVVLRHVFHGNEGQGWW